MIGKVVKDTCTDCGKLKFLANKSKKLCTTCVSIRKRQKDKETRELKKKKKTESSSFLIKKLDKIFSVFIRLESTDREGYAICFTCSRKEYWRKIQCGHFQSRRFMSTRFHVLNCRPQCYACNIGLSGNQYAFGLNLDKTFKKGTADEMVSLSKEIKKFTSEELNQLIEHYDNAVNKLRKKLNVWD
jgi:hypothetical protein